MRIREIKRFKLKIVHVNQKEAEVWLKLNVKRIFKNQKKILICSKREGKTINNCSTMSIKDKNVNHSKNFNILIYKKKEEMANL